MLKKGQRGKAPRPATIAKLAKVLKVHPKEIWDIIEPWETEPPLPSFPYSSEADQRGYLPNTLKRAKFIWNKSRQEVFGDEDVALLFMEVLEEKIDAYIKGEIDDGAFWEFCLNEHKLAKERFEKYGKEEEEGPEDEAIKKRMKELGLNGKGKEDEDW